MASAVYQGKFRQEESYNSGLEATISAEWFNIGDYAGPSFSNMTASLDITALIGPKPPKKTATSSPPPKQWHIENSAPGGFDVNVKTTWNDYTGKGVTVGVVDDGVQYTHHELAANYNAAIDADILRNTGDGIHKYSREGHGTAVAGTIAAANNGTGTTGVAYEATITSFRLLGYTSESVDGFNNDIIQAIRAGANVDISNNSWGFSSPFGGNALGSQIDAALEYGVTAGRDGLGTVYVYAAGNSGSSGDNANYSEMLNSRFTIAVGSAESSGVLSSFSTPGTPVLVVAPGSKIYTTDVTGRSGFSSGDYVVLSGTSFAAPIVSGVVALMLEANPNLGYRDVQEILAYSAVQTDKASSTWEINGADNWNGGGLHASEKYGFGFVDATAAVRLAETWDSSSPDVFGNEAVYSVTSSTLNAAIKDYSTFTTSISAETAMNINHVEVQLNLTHSKVGNLIIKLTSPEGTESILMSRPGNGKTSLAYNSTWSFSSTHHWGEDGTGTWTLSIQDAASGNTGTLNNWTLRLYGDSFSDDDTYIYTDEYGNFTGTSDASRRILSDDTGNDTINAAAVSSNTTLDLSGTSSSNIAGNSLTIASGTVIENAYTGDGNDLLKGNDFNNYLNSGRGDDTLTGGQGDDTLLGGSGNDSYEGFQGNFGDDILTDLSGTADIVDLSNFNLADVLSWTAFDSDSNSFADQLTMDFGGGNGITIDNYFDNSSSGLAGSGNIETIAFLDDSSVDFAQVQGLVA